MTVGKNGEIMVVPEHGDVASGAGGGGKSGVQLRRSHLPDNIPGQIYFLHHGVRTVLGGRTVNDQEVAVGQKLDGIYNIDGRNRRTRVISPQNVSAEISDDSIQFGSGGANGEQVQQFDAGLRGLAGGVGGGGEGVVHVGEDGGGGAGGLETGAHVVLRIALHTGNENRNGSSA